MDRHRPTVVSMDSMLRWAPVCKDRTQSFTALGLIKRVGGILGSAPAPFFFGGGGGGRAPKLHKEGKNTQDPTNTHKKGYLLLEEK